LQVARIILEIDPKYLATLNCSDVGIWVSGNTKSQKLSKNPFRIAFVVELMALENITFS
jgi:hypothetical protein